MDTSIWPARRLGTGTTLDQGQRNDLLELLDDRVGTRSTLVTSPLPIEH